jgi:nucleotide-binding universal stress UspA family protein
MFGTIIIGVDGRQGGRDALALGAALAEASGSELVAASAFPLENHPSRAASPAYRSVLLEETRKLLAAELEATGVRARPVAVQDTSPARGLHRLAEHEHAGLIVIGTSHHGPIGRMLLGDVTHGTLSSAPCAVAVAPKGFAARELRTIGVGFDGTPEAQRALELAVDLAREAGARLDVVTGVELPQAVAMYSSHLDAARLHRDAIERAERTLADATSGIGVAHTSAVVDERPAAALIELSQRVDLLVLGSRNWGPIRRLMVGSTSHAVAGHAECAVLVRPRGASVEEPIGAAEAEPTAAAQSTASSRA